MDTEQVNQYTIPEQLVLDFGSPLYMHPSENASSILAPTSFDGVGYRSWKRSVLRVLSVKNKIGFVNGECVRPAPTSPLYRQWERCDNMVTSWILNSLAKDIADSLQYVSDSVELWKELEDRYDQTNGTKLYQLQREINELAQGALDITGYYTKMKKLWEELNTVTAGTQCNCACNCGAKANVHKAEQDRNLIQFLMGLNEVYTGVRGNILMMNPLPSLAQAFSILLQEERQREVKPHNQLTMESTALNVKGSGNNNFRTNYSQNDNFNKGNNGFRGGGFPRGGRNAGRGSGNRGNYNSNRGGYGKGNYQNKSQMICDYCGRPGHTREYCFKRKADNERNGAAANVHGGSSENAENVAEASQATSSQTMQGLSKEQYNQLMIMLGNLHSSYAGEASSSFSSGTANFADQSVVDRAINDICIILQCSRHNLNVVSVGNGSVMGWLRYAESGRIIDCISSPNTAYLIPVHVEEVEDIISVAQYILVVEKESVFQRLANDQFGKRNRCIVITGRGYPDVPTRRFLRLLVDKLHLPVYCLVDCDPYGFDILTTYKFGSLQMAYDAAFLRVSEIQWLGVFIQDCDKYSIPQQCLLPLTPEDKRRVEAMLLRCYLQKEVPKWRFELELLLHKGVKFEIEALSVHSLTFLSHEYLPSKIHSGGYI